MASFGPRQPWRQKVRVHFKAICQAIPLSFFLVAEGRDMYYRATWEVTDVAPNQFHTGDVVAICNRWYTLPTWGHVLYSLLSKVLLKSSWDDVGVVWVRDGVPHLCHADWDGAKVLSVEEFVRARAPRGLALRRLRADRPPNASVAALFVEEARKLRPRPWYLFRASLRGGEEHKHYELAVEMNRQRRRLQEMIDARATAKAIAAQRERLQEMDVLREHVSRFVEQSGPFHLFNGSLVASFLATFDLLDRVMPPPSRYVPQDFAHDLPFKGAAHLEEPIVFYKN